MSETAKYKVLIEGPIVGTWREKGDVIELARIQAQAYLPPFGSQIEPINSGSKPHSNKETKK